MNLKKSLYTLAALTALFLLAGTTHAAMIAPGPTTFNEVFLGAANDANYLNMAERDLISSFSYDVGNKAKFWFDLTDIGGTGRLLNTSGVGDRWVQTFSPTTDETGYDASLFELPYNAYLDFYFTDFFYDDPANSPEKVRINLDTHRGLVNLDFVLEDDPDGQKMIRLDLVDLDLLDTLMDGQLLATVIASPFGTVNNTFILDRVELTAEAMPMPVPIPSAALVLGAGLIGLVGIRARRS